MNTEVELSTILKLDRPEILEVKQYGKYSERSRIAVYNDNDEQYQVMHNNKTTVGVNSNKAFVSFIKEELKRRNNIEGKYSTLTIGFSGGIFCADDNFNEGICQYQRQLSQQWEAMLNINDQILNHEQFLLALLKLSPSIQDFKKTYASFLKVRIIGKSEMTSNPVFVNNEAESGYLVKYTLEGGTGAENIIPDSFTLNLPYIKGDENKYEVVVDVQILNNGNNELRIKVNIPLLENIEEKAIMDEIEKLKKELSEQKELLVLSDV